MQSSSRWRLLVTANNGNIDTCIRRIHMYSEAGADLCVGGTASANGYTAWWVPAYAFDDSTNFWAAYPPLPAWIEYDFASPVVVYSYSIMSKDVADAATTTPSAWQLQRFDTGAAIWITVDTRTAQTGWGMSETRTYNTALSITQQFNAMVLCAKLESSYGVDAHPTASDALITAMPTFELVGKKVERKVLLPSYGGLAGITIGEAIKISFTMDLLTSGTAGTAPKIGRLLRACNMTEIISAGNYVDYLPHSTIDGESLTFYFYRGVQRFAATGCVGTVKIDCKANELVTLSFEFTGLYSSAFATASDMPVPVFGNDTGPYIFHGAGMSFMGLSEPVFEAIEFDLGNEVVKRMDANAAIGIKSYFVKSRSVKGSCDPEVVAFASYNPWNDWDGSTEGTVSCTIGGTAGQTCTITAPHVVLADAPKHAERENLTTYALGFSAHPSLTAGNNDIKLRFS